MPKFARNLLFPVILILLSSSFAFSLNTTDEEFRVYDLINRERRKNGLEEFRLNEKLTEIARNYSEKMARERFFAHQDSDGNRVEDRARFFNLKKYDKIGENLFFCAGYDNIAKFAVARWLESPTHKANIFDKEFTETGIGIVETRRGEIYITQIFLEP